ncbi:MAG: PQQ-binding-like beta-propeller repeat protein [Bryobacteraceae bacterium]
MRPWILLTVFSVAAAAEDDFAAGVFRSQCAACHEAANIPRVPTLAALKQMTSRSILRALEAGSMREQGQRLSRAERGAVANWLGRRVAETSAPDALANRCRDVSASTPRGAWTTWGGTVENRRFQTAAAAGLRSEDVPRLKLKWAFGLPDSSSLRSQPALSGGRLFVGGQNGTVFALDAATGCTHWETQLAGSVRSGIAVATVSGRSLAFAGDSASMVYAIDTTSGQVAWQVRVDEHPSAGVTGTPAYHDGRLYVPVASGEEGRAIIPSYVCCTFRGSLLALEAATGKQLWKTYTIGEEAKPRAPTKRGAKVLGPSGAAIWTPPTIDAAKRLVYVTTGDNYSDPVTTTSDAVMAIAMDTGKIVWWKQFTAGDAYNSSCPLADKVNCPDSDGPDHDFAAPAILVALRAGKRALLLPQKSGMLHAVDPDQQGKLLWQARVGEGGIHGGIQWGAASDSTRVYVALSDSRFTRTREPGSNNVIQTPHPEFGGGMFAFRTDNGERLWQTRPPNCGERWPCSPAQKAPVSGIEGMVFSGSMDGHLRAYRAENGKIVWDYDTARTYETVNGVAAKGGAMDAVGPVIGGGMVYVMSGYGQWGGMPGNVLLAFSVDGK